MTVPQQDSIPRLSLILPTLNEAACLQTLLPELLVLDEIAELIVVDDGSSDGTRRLVLDAAATDSRVRWHRRTQAPSLTASLREGIEIATGELVGWMDADGTMRGPDLARLVSALEPAVDIVVGSRFVAGGCIKGQRRAGFMGRLEAWQTLRQTSDHSLASVASWGLNALILPLLLGDGVHDYTSGFIVARRAKLQELALLGQHGEYFIHLWMQARRRAHRIVEVPYCAQSRLAGASKTIRTGSDYLIRSRQYLGAALHARWRRD